MDREFVEEKISQMRTFLRCSLSPAYYAHDFGKRLLDGHFDAEGEIYAAEFLESAAYYGHVDAMYDLGMCYRWGDGGVYADPNIAMKWFRRAAEKGHEEAKKFVESYDTEEGRLTLLLSAMDSEESVGSKWYKAKVGVDTYYEMARGGNESAQFHLAYQLANPQRLGPFVHNIDEAIHWYTEAANSGEPNAMFNLSQIYLEGTLGAQQDIALARFWMEKCAATGDAEAQRLLGQDDLWDE